MADELVYAAELHGHVHFLSARTGEQLWAYDTRASIWGALHHVGGRVLVPDQGEALAAWLVEHGHAIPAGEYAADIGFAPRDDAMGGGAALPVAALRQMADLNMALYLSEYPARDDAPPTG